MTTAWVTSFSNDLYLATGKSLLESYAASGSCGKLYVYPESVPTMPIPEGSPVEIMSDPGKYPELATFVEANKKIIHKDFGGAWTGPCKCPNPNDSKDKRHVAGCPNSWFCKHAIRWFRKVLSLHNFVTSCPDEFSRFIWLDSDVLFKKEITEELVTSWFNGSSVFFLKGPKRKVWETGILGMHDAPGKSFIVKTFEYYMSGGFREQPRWDDGFIFQKVAERDKALNKLDLATDASGHSDVAPHSPLGAYLTHNKGTHGRGLGIMK